MNFIFEDLSQKLNVQNCKDVNPSTIKRFPASPLIGTLARYKTLKWKFNNFSPGEVVFDTFNNRKKI